MNSTAHHTDIAERCIDICNSLLRGELSAIETYDHAIDKYAGSPAADELRRIRAEHNESAVRLAANVREMGGQPQTGSGAWGVFANAVQAAANLFGKESAIESLQRGEQMGCKDYENAMRDEDVMPDCRLMIRDELLPRTKRHVADLEMLAQAAHGKQV